MASAFLLANPAGGRGRVFRHIRELHDLAVRHGLEVRTSRDVPDLLAQARGAVAAGVERLLVAGGDGTLHYAIQALAGTECALGVLPLGSGNDLAGALGVPPALDRAMEVALAAPVRRIDLAQVGNRFYGCVGGVGFDAEVNRFANERVRLLRGPLIYAYAVLRVLRAFRAPAMEIVHPGGTFSGRAMFAVVANAPRYGGGMRIAPMAVLDDGWLDLVIVREISRLDLLRVFPQVFSGKHIGHPAIETARVQSVTVKLDRAMWLYADGEPVEQFGVEPREIAVRPGRLAVAGG